MESSKSLNSFQFKHKTTPKRYNMNHVKLGLAIRNKAYRKAAIDPTAFETFTNALEQFLSHIEATDKRERINETFITNFLKSPYYEEHLITAKNDIDLAIYLDRTVDSNIGVLMEVKSISNTNEFLRINDINRKALQQLLLYYLEERIIYKNNNIKRLIATNGREWYIFDAEDFYKFFYKKTALKKEFQEYYSGQKDSSSTNSFYKDIASKYIAEVANEIPFLYIDLDEMRPLLKGEKTKSRKLVLLSKIFSQHYLLKKPYGNDNNQLNNEFYNELLHIIGLKEGYDKDNNKGKKIIRRKSENNRNYGSLLESTIFTLEEENYLEDIAKIYNLKKFGPTKNDQLFNIALQLCLTWVNRILFLKLLEAQLLSYHKNASEYKFLNTNFISGFDRLNELFFSVLAKTKADRHERIKQRHIHIPYLNSSLFEPIELEKIALRISNVMDTDLDIFNKTVLTNSNGDPLSGKLGTLDYFFKFLDAYDFSNEESDTDSLVGSHNKSLISASVLGLIFEKINGYKDGSFYTPSYITMYMSRETLRRAVVQKFNTHYNWKCRNFSDLQEDLKDHIRLGDRNVIRIEANEIINSLKICDPAVGSGHFLVSSLNELIVIKSELGVLINKDGSRLNTYIRLDNDELIIENENDEFFQYNPLNKESTLIQKTLFHEKQTLIENCLFGVDINPNSVKICRLRLWIELLKNAYYTEDNELQTLPNIDINIKSGNSLISRFGLKKGLSSTLKKLNLTVKDYKGYVQQYKQAKDKNERKGLRSLIKNLKTNFATGITQNSTEYKNYYKAKQEYNFKYGSISLFDNEKSTLSKKQLKDKIQLEKNIKKYETQLENIKNSIVYQDAFEWRFEFPEVLDSEGNFMGFDVIIGNPPWVSLTGKHGVDLPEILINHYKRSFSENTYMPNLYEYFVQKIIALTKEGGFNCLIVPDRLAANHSLNYLRKKILTETKLLEVSFRWDFPEIITDTLTYLLKKEKSNNHKISIRYNTSSDFVDVDNLDLINDTDFRFLSYKNKSIHQLIKKVNVHPPLSNIALSTSGFGGKSKKIYEQRTNPDEIEVLKGKSISRYSIKEPLYFHFTDVNITGRTRDEEKLGAKPKVLLRKTGIPLIAALDEDGIYPEQSLYFIYKIKPKISPKYILALFNSKLFTFFYRHQLVTNIDSTPQLKNSDLNKFPICVLRGTDSIILLVDQILTLKKEDPQTDTSTLEQQIDVLVYKLYSLTYEEVLVVDEGFGELMGEEAYAAVEL